MSTLLEQLRRLRESNRRVRGADKELGEESLELAQTEGLEVAPSPEEVEQALDLESIVMRTQRPVLAIRENSAVLEFQEAADSEIWKARLETARPFLNDAIRSVGRIELTGSTLDWVGTGWMVSDSILVTNRHVANVFAERKGQGFVFKMGSGKPIGAAVDFLQEIGSPATLVFKLRRPLFIQESGPDVSFFEVEVEGGDARLAKPIALSDQPAATENAAVIGYPAFDSRIPEPDLMERIYGKTYNKKRLAPGGVTRVEQSHLFHDCTTLGGNSGSAVVDLKSGKALGLHFSGSFLTTNYAVRSDVVKKLLANVRMGRVKPEGPRTIGSQMAPAVSPRYAIPQMGQSRTTTVTIPLTVTVSLGDVPPPTPYRTSAPRAVTPDASDVIDGEEAVAADYRDRKGYDEEFLGRSFAVPLPSVDEHTDDVLEYDNQGETDTELRYEHYSVVMSKSRRMCFFSAVNIDGNQSKKTKRAGWKWDPRIPKSQQIMNECYGSPPKFSRGHMTRREDPAWGNTGTADRGNQDSMHVTNTTPQMQAFNAPIWLALEDYALQHAREDEMRISVFTGPFFTDEDPVKFKVQIPTSFWKIIAFIHDETGKLCATGYQMTQEQSLRPEDEFVFGPFTSPQLHVATQVSIRSIEERSGLSFGKLASIDPLAGEEEGLGVGGPRAPLQRVEEIRFV